MTQLSPDPNDSQPTGPDATAGTPASTVGSAAGAGGGVGGQPKYDAVAGPFTIRDLTVFGSALLMFIASLLPMFAGVYNLWNVGNLFFLLLGIILPLVVVALFVARRLRPEVVVRVGSLSVDQFASVTASFAVPLFFLTVATSYNTGALVGLVGSAGLLVATVLAPHLPFLSADFKGRTEVPAHVVARKAAVPSRKPVVPRPPKAAKPAAPAAAPGAVPSAAGSAVVHAADATPAQPAPTSGASPATREAAPGQDTAKPSKVSPSEESQPEVSQAAVSQAAPPAAAVPEAVVPRVTAQQPSGERPWAATMATPIVSGNTASVADSIGATVDPSSRPEESAPRAYEAFWFAVAQPRTAYDERSGAPVFTIDPGGWVLALEDRGDEFLVQDGDGKIGVLRELSNIERG